MIKLGITPQDHYDLYLFGSVLYSEEPCDIDLAIIYDKNFVSAIDAIQYRKELLEDLSHKSNLSIDTILLSKEEEKQTKFLMNAKHEKIEN